MSALERLLPVPPAAVSRVLSRFDRRALEGFISVAIDLLDLADGDADLEESGDEQDGIGAEDEPCAAFELMGNGPGCLISDDDSAVDDRACDDINQDQEPEEGVAPAYGFDQTKGPILPHQYTNRDGG